jgi:stage II sporulation protein D
MSAGAAAKVRSAREAATVFVVTAALAALLVSLSIAGTIRPAPATAPPARLLDGPPIMRVQLLRAGDGPWTIESPAGAVMRAGGPAGEPFGARVTRAVVARQEGRILIDGRLAPPQISFCGITPDSDIVIDGRRYRGTLVLDADPKAPAAVLHVPLETYMAQVLPGEMPMNYPREALRAQSIAGRTYAVAQMLRRRGAAHDVNDDETSQMFLEVGPATERAAGIVAETRGMVLVHDGRPFLAYYSANCGGRTRSNAEAFGEAVVAPLRGRECGFCAGAEDHEWTATFKVDQAARALELDGRIRGARLGAANPSGFEREVWLDTAAGEVRISGRRLKGALGFHRVKSSLITGVAVARGALAIQGRGFGHGVGLCQNGCRGLANAGKSAAEIAIYYYPGAELSTLDW